jgi:hypothetical protein
MRGEKLDWEKANKKELVNKPVEPAAEHYWSWPRQQKILHWELARMTSAGGDPLTGNSGSGNSANQHQPKEHTMPTVRVSKVDIDNFTVNKEGETASVGNTAELAARQAGVSVEDMNAQFAALPVGEDTIEFEIDDEVENDDEDETT